ncbi:CPBP family intramembrane metalloprotease [Parvimonas micra]|uniref:CPBP family intramembrane glutamic endopeptidase n=1 Tax=Parvimonas micra TaxID=33033 RepID=UPI0022B75243|nr:CPBP family intramembrane glutamic endopeptidase [Parvimonas micra]WBB33579.1 CPBP family intramembrane metalloprotease [Parvimonas micra]WBB35100.1 CPBP family intramembrane metalloprotease [Parvimonas micra]
MLNANLLNSKNFKKWILPILIFLAYKYYSKNIVKLSVVYGLKSFAMIYFIVHVIGILFFICLTYFVYDDKFNSIDDSKKMNLLKSVLISVVVFIISLYLDKIISVIVYNVFGNVKSINDSIIKASEKVSIFTYFEVSFAGPILEEIVYRQLLFGYLYDLHSRCNKYIRFITASIISSIIFGSIHDGVFHPYMLFYVTTGIILSSLYVYTKRLSSPIIVHILHNLF